ncbi:MAG: glycosyltransferase family 39 protein [Leptolyngbya sp.]|nr:glycosyltransferase family 39 protein [Leptolyngbya sp.]
MVALTTGLGWWLTGTIAPFTLRWGALLLYPLSLWLLYLTGRRLYGERAGTLAVAIASLAPLLWLGFGTLTSPDNGLMLFWSLSLYLAAVEFFAPRPSGPQRRRLDLSPQLAGGAVGANPGAGGVEQVPRVYFGVGVGGLYPDPAALVAGVAIALGGGCPGAVCAHPRPPLGLE